jgi:hypothetical protein
LYDSLHLRALAGSLASFDTSSIVNTEGIPLLEETEFETEGSGNSVTCWVFVGLDGLIEFSVRYPETPPVLTARPAPSQDKSSETQRGIISRHMYHYI